MKILKQPFDLGHTVTTPGALTKLSPEVILSALARHTNNDWGDCNELDWEANDTAVLVGSRVFSVYTDPNGVVFWVITEADRSSTCVLLSEEY